MFSFMNDYFEENTSAVLLLPSEYRTFMVHAQDANLKGLVQHFREL